MNFDRQEYMQKLSNQLREKHQTLDTETRPNSDMASFQNPLQYTDDATINRILSKKQKLVAFREIVILHLKKNDLSTKIIAEDIEQQSTDIVLSLNSFKQCLKTIGVYLSPQVSPFLTST